MISRLTFSAAVFAVLATATLTFAADSQHAQRSEAQRSAAATAQNPIVVMPKVEIVGRRAR